MQEDRANNVRLQRALLRIANRQLGGAFACWVAAYHELLNLRRRMRKVYVVWRHRIVSAFFRRWAFSQKGASVRRRVLAKFGLRMQSNSLKALFLAWRQALHVKASLAHHARVLLRHTQVGCAFRAVHIWIGVIRRRRAFMRVWRRSSMKHSAALVWRCFGVWLDVYRRRRCQLRTVAHATRLLQRKTMLRLYHTFDAWRAEVIACAKKKHRLTKLVEQARTDFQSANPDVSDFQSANPDVSLGQRISIVAA